MGLQSHMWPAGDGDTLDWCECLSPEGMDAQPIEKRAFREYVWQTAIAVSSWDVGKFHWRRYHSRQI